MEQALETFFKSQPGIFLTVEIVLILALLAKGADWLVGEAVVLSERSGLPKVIIGATIVSLGTTTPEAAVSVLAALQGKYELAIGNVIGADILNVLFVAGVSAAVTPGGLPAPALFFQVLFPAMLVVLIAFRIGVMLFKDHMKRSYGIVLIAVYAMAMMLSYTSLRGEAPAANTESAVATQVELSDNRLILFVRNPNQGNG